MTMTSDPTGTAGPGATGPTPPAPPKPPPTPPAPTPAPDTGARRPRRRGLAAAALAGAVAGALVAGSIALATDNDIDNCGGIAGERPVGGSGRGAPDFRVSARIDARVVHDVARAVLDD